MKRKAEVVQQLMSERNELETSMKRYAPHCALCGSLFFSAVSHVACIDLFLRLALFRLYSVLFCIDAATTLLCFFHSLILLVLPSISH